MAPAAASAASSAPLRIGINGAAGRMGGVLCQLIAADAHFALAHAALPEGAAQTGTAVYPGASALRFSQGWADAPALDMVIDFSAPAGLREVLAFCLRTGTALVTGTTGCDATLQAQLHAAGERIALMQAANFSLGIAVLTRLLREAAAALPAWDAEVLELHHAAKRDAPSGTALALGRALTTGRDANANPAVANTDRSGLRVAGSVGYAVLRGGDVVGEHTALLIGQGERLELTHRASDRAVFARGALHAAHWLARQAPGSWSLEDMLASSRV
jgi:4-hydroxy-tetrahydrodipicolinate reductase